MNLCVVILFTILFCVCKLYVYAYVLLYYEIVMFLSLNEFKVVCSSISSAVTSGNTSV